MTDQKIKYDLTEPGKWPKKLLGFAIEAMSNQRLHGARARRLIDAGICIRLDDGRCGVVLQAQDAINNYLIKSRLSMGLCKCGDRELEKCPGAWEQGCDLSSNAKFVKVYTEEGYKLTLQG